jgi:hypothetical protein
MRDTRYPVTRGDGRVVNVTVPDDEYIIAVRMHGDTRTHYVRDTNGRVVTFASRGDAQAKADEYTRTMNDGVALFLYTVEVR